MVGVVTNLVVALKITTTTLVPASCPDGIEGCLVQHLKEHTEVQYVEPKADPTCAPVDVLVPDTGAVRSAWMDAEKARDEAFMSGCSNVVTVPIRAYTEGRIATKRSPRIVGLIHVPEFTKAVEELDKGGHK